MNTSGASSRPTDEEVVARYDRYLQDFVEALNICPFARRARELHRLQRAVIRGEPTPEAVVDLLQRVTAVPTDQLDVAVVILPDSPLEPFPFNRFVGRVRESFTRVSSPPHGYFLVAMHPDWHKDLSTPDKAVAFMRRTPHPSIQVARARVIVEARGTTPAGEESVSDRVARLGLAAVERLGADRAEDLLRRIRDGRG